MNGYHVNWLTGNVQSCQRADCDEEFHSMDYVATARHYEASMANYLLPAVWTKINRPRS